MLTIYLACLIFGGILLSVSLFSGSSDTDSDVDHDFDSDHNFGDIDSTNEITTHSFEHSAEHTTDFSDNSAHITDAIKFFSFRNIIFFLTFFGLTGTVLNFLHFGSILTGLVSFVMGGFSAGFGYQFMKYLKNSETGTDSSIKLLEGRIGKVVIPVSKNKPGKLLLESRGQYFEIQALIAENSEYDYLKRGEEVLVLEIINNMAYIEKNDL